MLRLSHSECPSLSLSRSRSLAPRATRFALSSLARLFHGFASANYNPHSLLPYVCARYSAPDALNEFASRDLALLIVSLGKLVVEPPSGFCKALVSRAKDLVPASSKASSKDGALFDVHLNSLVMWSFARLGLKKTSYVTRSLKYLFLQGNVERHEMEDLIAVMWACCRLDVQLTSAQIERLSKRLRKVVTWTVDSDGRSGGSRVETTAHSSALCRGFRYVSMLYSKRKDKGRDRVSDASTELNALRIAYDIFRGGMADRLSPWELSSVVVAMGGFGFSDGGGLPTSTKSSTKPSAKTPASPSAASMTLPVRSIQRHLISATPHVDGTMLPKLTYTVAKLGLAANNAAFAETLSGTVVSKSGVLTAQGLVQTAYSFALMGTKGKTDVARAIAPKLVDKCGSLSSKDLSRACFSMYQLGKQSGERGSELHAACKDIMIGHVTEADVGALEASSLFGLVLAFGSVAARHGADPNAKDAVQRLRGWLVASLVRRCRGFTSARQIKGVQAVLAETKAFAGGDSSSSNLDTLVRACARRRRGPSEHSPTRRLADSPTRSLAHSPTRPLARRSPQLASQLASLHQ